MEKMTNVLLASNDAAPGKVSAGGVKQGDKSQAQSSEPTDFSVALEQANAQVKQKKTTEKNMSDTSFITKEASQGKGDIDADKETAEMGNVNHVLAQINLASELADETEADQDGELLPPLSDDISQGTEFDQLLARASSSEQALPNEASVESTADVDANAEETVIGLPLLNPDTDEPLDKELLSLLVQESGKSEAELNLLPPQDLAKLIAEVKPLLDQAKVLSTVKSTEQNNALKASLDGSDSAKIASDSTSDQKLSGLESPNKANQSVEQGKASSFSHILGEKSSVEDTTKLQVSNKLSNEANAQQQLKGAELTVKQVSVNTHLDLGLGQADTAETDTKAIQTSSATNSATTPLRAETPQFQLSLKQSSEQASSMQDMIQRFSPVMKQQLVTMVSQGIQHAEIRLDPPELGQLMVRVQVQGDQTQVQFQVAQHQTRDLVEQALPRLKELLAEQGLQLTDSQVSQQDSGSGNAEEGRTETEQEGYDQELDDFSADESLLSSNQATSYRSGIDYYA